MTEKWKIILFTIAFLSMGFLQRIYMLQLYLKLWILSFLAWSIIKPLALPENTCSWLCKGQSQQLVRLWRTSGFFAAGSFSLLRVSGPMLFFIHLHSEGFRWHFGAGNIMCQKIAVASYCVSYCFLCQEVSEHKHFPIALIFRQV